ncbi:MAG TPA: class I SAM-dependent methyltransferase [Pyrinomonadaceae bacterium]|nr:class I SAM-dependent methyltransferase [Pyrinomonadaceae bacterium]
MRRRLNAQRLPDATRLLAATVTAALLTAALSGCASDTQPQQASKPPATPRPPANVANVQLTEDPLDVPYVPTPDAVVARMLEVAKVNSNDLLYDLGSGDGRIVITAAKRYGARGVGYDLNPRRIEESNENARKARVTDRVRFVEQDLFEADLTGATVVTIYLLPTVNMKLRPKLLKDLAPGTRVVSHNYGMGDWNPISVDEIDVGGAKHYVYYWIVPPAGKLPNQ